jgi:hypothetical protein
MLIARRAALTDSSHRAARTAVDKIRSEVCLAICKLAAAIEANKHLIEENQPDAIVNTLGKGNRPRPSLDARR